MNILQILKKKQIVNPPDYVVSQLQYLAMMGSVAYGVSGDTSDVDVYGFCIPKKELIFPHLSGEIEGFGSKGQRFEQWQEHHVEDKESRKQYDFTIFSIIKYFSL